jgi:hypothetical protein
MRQEKEIPTTSMDEPKSRDFVVWVHDSKSRVLSTQTRSRRISTAVNKVAFLFSQITHNPAVSIVAYCLASISMTVINKYCVSGPEWNMNFLLLAFQVSLPADFWHQLSIVVVHHLHIDNSCLQMAWDHNLSPTILLLEISKMQETSSDLHY